MENNEKDDLMQEIAEMDDLIDDADCNCADVYLIDCVKQTGEVLKMLAERLVDKKESKGEVVNDIITVGNKSLEDTLDDLEDEIEDWGNKVKDLEDTSDVIKQRDTCRYSKRKPIPTRKLVSSKRLEVEHRMSKHDELEDIKDNIKEDRTKLCKLLHDYLYRDITELRKICASTDIYRKRFDQDDFWFVDSIDGTMDTLERSGRDYMELLDSLVSYIDDLITKIDNGEIE